jgi:hypothetical protein
MTTGGIFCLGVVRNCSLLGCELPYFWFSGVGEDGNEVIRAAAEMRKIKFRVLIDSDRAENTISLLVFKKQLVSNGFCKFALLSNGSVFRYASKE